MHYSSSIIDFGNTLGQERLVYVITVDRMREDLDKYSLLPGSFPKEHPQVLPLEQSVETIIL